jgi:acetolactate synthase I/II/III large subunit
LAEKLDAPAAMTINSRGILPPAHELGISWSASNLAVHQMVQKSDLIVASGTGLGPTDYDLYADRSFDFSAVARAYG